MKLIKIEQIRKEVEVDIDFPVYLKGKKGYTYWKIVIDKDYNKYVTDPSKHTKFIITMIDYDAYSSGADVGIKIYHSSNDHVLYLIDQWEVSTKQSYNKQYQQAIEKLEK